jgi:hypothetical protein
MVDYLSPEEHIETGEKMDHQKAKELLQQLIPDIQKKSTEKTHQEDATAMAVASSSAASSAVSSSQNPVVKARELAVANPEMLKAKPAKRNKQKEHGTKFAFKTLSDITHGGWLVLWEIPGAASGVEIHAHYTKNGKLKPDVTKVANGTNEIFFTSNELKVISRRIKFPSDDLAHIRS